MCFVVCLEDANAIDPPERCEDCAKATQHNEPRLKTTIGEIIRIWTCRRWGWSRLLWICHHSWRLLHSCGIERGSGCCILAFFRLFYRVGHDGMRLACTSWSVCRPGTAECNLFITNQFSHASLNNCRPGQSELLFTNERCYLKGNKGSIGNSGFENGVIFDAGTRDPFEEKWIIIGLWDVFKSEISLSGCVVPRCDGAESNLIANEIVLA